MLPNKKIKSFLFVFFSLSFVFFSSTTKISADQISSTQQDQELEKSWAVPGPEDFARCVDDTFKSSSEGEKICAEAYSGLFTPINLIYGTNCILGGVNCTNVESTVNSDGYSRQNFFYQRSLLGQTDKLILALYENPPADTKTWLADVAENLGFVPKAYAQQGIGFAALSPLLDLWKIMRNIAYTLFIIILLVIGLMIMLRTKIDPRTVISFQSALPRIVITLLLITFSYPLAGLMIDLMYVVLFLGISIIGPLISPDIVPSLQADFGSGGGIWKLFWSVPDSVWWDLGGSLLSFFVIPLGIAHFGAKLGGTLKTILTGTKTINTKLGAFGISARNVVMGLSGFTGILGLLVLFAFIFAFIRIFFILLNAYVQIIISIIFAPIFLIGQAIPGQNSFSSWLKNLLANLSVFPSTAILLLISDIVSDKFYGGGERPSWTPPVLGDFGSLLGGLLIPLGFALVIPQLVLSVKKMFGAKPTIPITGAASRVISQPLGIGQQFLHTVTQWRMFKGGGGH